MKIDSVEITSVGKMGLRVCDSGHRKESVVCITQCLYLKQVNFKEDNYMIELFVWTNETVHIKWVSICSGCL